MTHPDILIDLSSRYMAFLPLGLTAEQRDHATRVLARTANCSPDAGDLTFHTTLNRHTQRSLWLVRGQQATCLTSYHAAANDWQTASGQPLNLAFFQEFIQPVLRGTPVTLQGTPMHVQLTERHLRVGGAVSGDAGLFLAAWMYWCGTLPELTPESSDARRRVTLDLYAGLRQQGVTANHDTPDGQQARAALLDRLGQTYMQGMLEHGGLPSKVTGVDLFMTVYGMEPGRLPGYVLIEGQQLILESGALREPYLREGQSAPQYATELMQSISGGVGVKDLLLSGMYVTAEGVCSANTQTSLLWYTLCETLQDVTSEGVVY